MVGQSDCVTNFKQSIVRRTESLLSGIERNIERNDTQSAAVALCQAYSLAPRRTRKQLRRIERVNLVKLVKVLEKFLIENNGDSSLTVKKISELILLPEVDANNSVAWRIRLWMLLESEEYAEVVLNTNRLSSMPASNETAELYLMCSLAHMKTGVKDTGLELYQTAINIDSIKARKCIVSIGEDNKMIIYKTLLEKASQLHRNMTSLSTKDSVDMLNYYSEIWRLCPNDINSAEIYGQLLMKVFRYEDAKVIFEGIVDQLESKGDLFQAVRFRLYHADCLVNIASFEEAVLDYLEAMEHDSCLTQITLQSLSNVFVNKLTACVIEQASTLVNQITCDKGEDSDQNNADSALQLYRRLYKLLYAIDSENVDALRKCAESLHVAGKHEDAVALLTEAIRKTPSVHLLCERAMSYLGMKNFKMAQTDLECASHLQGNSIEVHSCKAYLNFLMGKAEKAVEDLSFACSVSPATTTKVLKKFTEEQYAIMTRGIEKYIHDYNKKMLPEIKAKSKLLIYLCDLLINLSPDKLDYYIKYSDVLFALNMREEAQAIMLRMVKNSSKDCLPIIHLAALRLKLGNAELAMEGFGSVLREVDEERLAAELSEFSKKDRAQISREAHIRGLALFREKKYCEAIDCFGVAIAAASCHAPDSFLARARCLMQMQHYLKAISDFTAVIKWTPTCVEARCGRACVYVRLQEHLAASRDILYSLHSNIPATTRYLASLPDIKLRMVLLTLEKYLQIAFAYCEKNGDITSSIHEDSSMTCGESLLLLSNLLITLAPNEPKYLSIYGDALIVHRRYSEAIARLREVQLLLPLDVSIIARISLLFIKVDDHDAAINELSKISEEWNTLTFCMQAMDEGTKFKIALASFQHAELLKKKDNNSEALKYYTVAVVSSCCRDAGILRARGKCLESLQEYGRAIQDFSTVLALPSPQVSDFCARAIAYMMDDDDERACRDFMTAIERDSKTALIFINSKPGKDSAVSIFLTSARIAHARKDFRKAHVICEHGLMVDENDVNLLALKEKCESNMQKCILM
ncbi:uncharacterized protein LOC124443834 isoform X2 [Xenia sp. Carnegie-2017]|nr:uncharacterized protein LOC124443834 isoform X2 [Xenia sp. Carnegie-2017]